MDLFIDRANLKCLLSSKAQEDNKEYYWDCRRLMSRQLHLVYNFPKPYSKDEDYPTSSDVDDAGWGEETSNVNTMLDEYFNPSQQNIGWKELEDTFCGTIEEFDNKCDKSIFKVCLIDDSQNHKIKKDNVLIGEVGEEIEILKKLFCGDDYDLSQLYDLQSETAFPNWEQFERDRHVFPTQDIVIFDRYLISFCEKEGKVYNNCNKNIYELCDVLTKNSNSHVNILIFTLSSKKYIAEFKKIQKYISKQLKTKKDVRLTFVLIPDYQLDKGDYPRNNKIDAPHDRFILTNYRLIRSGDSFSYFDYKGNKHTNGKSLDVDSIAKNSITEYANSLLKDLSELCCKVNCHCIDFNEERIVGPRISNMVETINAL